MSDPYFSVMGNQSRLKVAAFSWAGTPFHSNGGVRGPCGGVSCVRLILELAIDSGAVTEGQIQLPDTPIDWHMHNDISLISDFFRSMKLKKLVKRFNVEDGLMVGDILILKVKRTEHHLAQLIDPVRIIHCHRKKGVMVTALDQVISMVSGVYRIFA